MSNVIRLWDFLFSDTSEQGRFFFLNFICVACVQIKREFLFEDDFAVSMEELQSSTSNIVDIRGLVNEGKRW